MIRTQIQLPEKEYVLLKEMAHNSSRSMADCVREAVAVYIASSHRAAEDFASVAGKFHPISTDDLKPHDRFLSDSISGRDI
jgi:predicted DNA-binding protein